MRNIFNPTVTHTRTDADRKFPCLQCSRKFFTTTELQNHTKGVHNTNRRKWPTSLMCSTIYATFSLFFFNFLIFLFFLLICPRFSSFFLVFPQFPLFLS